MAKTHFGYVERANESDNNDYWSSTACGLEYTESDMTDRKNEVTCKNCLRALAKPINDASALPIPNVSGSLPISDAEYKKVTTLIYPKDNSKKFHRQ